MSIKIYIKITGYVYRQNKNENKLKVMNEYEDRIFFEKQTIISRW